MNLSRRERFILTLGLLAVAALLVVKLMVVPYREHKQRMIRQLASKTETLEKMQTLGAQYKKRKQKIEEARRRFAKRAEGFRLYSFLDQLAGTTRIKDHIEYMKPSETTGKEGGLKTSKVEMKFDAVNMEQLTDYLHRVEMSPNMVFVRRMSVKKAGKDEGFIDVVLEVETYETG